MIIRQPLACLALASLVLSVLSALVIAIDIGTGRRQTMKIMEITWSVTALYMGPLALLFYFRMTPARYFAGLRCSPIQQVYQGLRRVQHMPVLSET